MTQEQSVTTPSLPENAVAIIGMAGRFPGAPDVRTFWDNVRRGTESLRVLDRDSIRQVSPEVRDRDDYVPVRGILDDVDRFDAAFFGIAPREAEAMDPQQRVFLECCWHALEDAGRITDRHKLVTGIFAGQSLNTYLLSNLCRDRAFIDRITAAYQTGEFPVLFGNDPTFLATRVAHKLDLRGPAITVQTACSTSLVAVVQAVQSLLAFQCDLCLAGGISISFPQERGHLFLEGSMVSPDGHCRPFDASAAGTVFGSGGGAVVLRRLEDAIAAGDRIYAVIRGAAVNNDGADKPSYSAPSVAGQRDAIATAITLAGVDPDTIGYVEAHGTGTPLGDPIEVEAISKAFRDCGATGSQFCAIGSLKSNIGHLEAGAGIAGLIKATFAVHDGILPPTLHFQQANPHIDFASSPFHVPTTTQSWTTNGHPRRAGVSAFGVGGTNAHVVIEQAPASDRGNGEIDIQEERPAVVTLSAQTADGVARAAADLASHLETHATVDIHDVAATHALGRESFAHRIAASGTTARSLADALRSAANSPQARAEAGGNPPRLVFMFPGQGAQRAGMLRDLYRTESVVREVVDSCAPKINQRVGRDVRDLLLAESADQQAAELLRETRFTQPCLFITELAIARLWQSWGVEPAALVGHSVGEYVAACLAGVMSVDDALGIVARRGSLVQEQPTGAMLAVRLAEAELAPLVPADCSIAAVNAPELCVVAGPDKSITLLEIRLEKDGRAARRLVTSHAFHSPMMDPVVPALEETIAAAPLHAPKLPILSTVTARALTEGEARDPHYWAVHARKTVRFADALSTLAAQGPCLLLEVGPGRTLAQLARQHPAMTSAVDVIASQPLTGEQPDGALELADAAGRLWMHGVPVDWRKRGGDTARRIVSLPGYPFADTRYWIDAPELETEVKGEVRSKVSTTAAASAPIQRAESRRARILREVFELLEGISGHPMDGASPDANLLDLGFDSLLLAQVSTSVRDRFGVPVTFRQLMEQLSTPALLAARLDSEMPEDAEQPVPTIPPRAGHATPEAAAAVEALVQQQLELMRKQLELLGGAENTSPLATALKAQLEQAGRHQSPGGVKPLETDNIDAGSRSMAATEGTRHGPFRPLEKSKGDALTARQRTHLDALIEHYCARTASSKSYAARHRAGFCDPRSVSGFHPLWKEMVYPIVCARSKGPRLWDADGNEYLDITMGFGVNFFGHTPDFISRAIVEQLERGCEIGPQTPLAGEVAGLLCELTGMERATLCNTGSEAVMAAMRVARTVTGRNRIVIFSGDYHGMFDSVLVRGVRRSGKPTTLPIAPGIPRGLIEDITVLEYGADESLAWIRAHGREIAAVIVEPVQSRNPALQPRAFLHQLRQLTLESETALVFDEVITGFRCHLGGAQAWFEVRADMATYGKVIGGGMPIGALAGGRKWMDALDGGDWRYGDNSIPEVGVTFFAGTFVRHPLAMAAAFAALSYLKEQGPELQKTVNARARRLADELNAMFQQRGLAVSVDNFASVFRVEFPSDYKHTGLFFYHLRLRGIHFWEGRVGFISTTHTDADIDRIIAVFRESTEAMQSGGFLPAPGEAFEACSRFLDARPHAIVDTPEGRRVPLTEEQHEVWLACQLGEAASTNFNESGTLNLSGPVDIAALECAVRKIVDRHEALRSVFLEDGSAQLIKARIEVSIERVELPSNPAAREAWLRDEAACPFDLSRGPLFRFRLAVTERGASLVFTAHHLSCDGWSYDILLHELGVIYSALVRGEPAPTLPAPTQISEFAANAPMRAASTAAQAAREFWQRELADMPPPPALPEDFPRPVRARFNGDRESIVIPAETVAAIKAFARGQRTTLFTTLFASFGSLLHRLSGAEDMLIGVPVAGQNVHSVESLVGHCVHFLPIRHRVDPTAEFSSHVRKTSAVLLEAFEHSHVSFGELLRELKWTRDPSRPSPLGITFNLDPTLNEVRFEGLELELELNPRSTINAELCFNVLDRPEGLVVECDYCTDIFSAATVRRWLRQFQTMMESAIRSPSVPIGRLPLVSEAEQRVLTGGRADPSIPLLLHRLFEARAAATPDELAVKDARSSLTYAELEARANRLAHHLVRNDARPEHRVVVHFEHSVEFVVAVLAVLKSGAAFVPLDVSWPQERKAAVIENSGARLFLTHGLRPPSHGVANLVVIDTSRDAGFIEALPATPVETEVRPENLAYVIYTSGTTGTPKGVMIEHHSIAAHITSIAAVYQLSHDDRCLWFHSTAFDPTVEQLFAAFHAGASIVARGDALWTGLEFARQITAHDLTVVDIPPRYLQQALQELKASGTVPSLGKLRLVIVGGETLPPCLARLWRECGLTHIRLINSYGPTECCVTATCYDVPVEPSPSELAGHMPIGRSHGPVRAYVLGPDLLPVPHDVKGELCIGGPTVGRGYLGLTDMTTRRFVSNPYEPGGRLYRTGDIARLLADGTLEFLGRFDRQVQVRGFRVELAEIETHLLQHPGTNNAAVIAAPDALGALELAAFIEPAQGATVSAEDLREHLGRHLPAYMIPARFALVARLPVDANGKLDHQALALLETRELTGTGTHVEPRNETEAELARIWTTVLLRDRVGVRDDFFDLGGHSLLAMQMVRAIHDRFATALPLATLMASPTIEALARLLPAPVPAVAETQDTPHSRQQPESAPQTSPEVEDPEFTRAPNAPRISTGAELRGSGPGVPLFNIPGVFGYGLLPPPVIAYIHRDRPFYDGLQLPGADGLEKPLESVEEIADHLVNQIRSVRPHGPYAITGYCYGGLLAYEVANRLMTAGEIVQALVLWHAFPWHTWRLRTLGERIRGLTGQLKAMPMTDRFHLLKARVAGPVRDLAHRIGWKQAEPVTNDAEQTPIVQANYRAGDLYRVKRPYHGRIYVARATVIPPDLEPPPLGGWEGFARGPFKIHDLGCEHLEMIRQPWLNEVSRLTAQWLRAADSEPVIRRTSGTVSEDPRKAFPRPLGSAAIASPGSWAPPRKRRLSLR